MFSVFSNKPIERSNIRKVLVRATNWIGDVVMTIPALEAVRENFPNASLSVLARPWVAPLVDNLPFVDEVIRYHKGRGIPAGFIGVIKTAMAPQIGNRRRKSTKKAFRKSTVNLTPVTPLPISECARAALFLLAASLGSV